MPWNPCQPCHLLPPLLAGLPYGTKKMPLSLLRCFVHGNERVMLGVSRSPLTSKLVVDG